MKGRIQAAISSVYGAIDNPLIIRQCYPNDPKLKADASFTLTTLHRVRLAPVCLNMPQPSSFVANQGQRGLRLASKKRFPLRSALQRWNKEVAFVVQGSNMANQWV